MPNHHIRLYEKPVTPWHQSADIRITWSYLFKNTNSQALPQIYLLIHSLRGWGPRFCIFNNLPRWFWCASGRFRGNRQTITPRIERSLGNTWTSPSIDNLSTEHTNFEFSTSCFAKTKKKVFTKHDLHLAINLAWGPKSKSEPVIPSLIISLEAPTWVLLLNEPPVRLTLIPTNTNSNSIKKEKSNSISLNRWSMKFAKAQRMDVLGGKNPEGRFLN